MTNNFETPSFKEDHISQIPALQLLINLGYKYLTPEEALNERGGKTSNVILDGVLEKQLREINKIQYKGNEYPFSNNNIAAAVNVIKNIPYDGLVRTNEKIYDLLSLGKSFEETILDNTKSFDLKFINWDEPTKNVFHVTEEFGVMQANGKGCRRPDIVLFVNGIPFVVIECKRRDKDVQSGDKQIDKAIKQIITYQREDEIPHLFAYAQMVMATSVNDVLYATTGTARKFWSVWREEGLLEEVVHQAANEYLPAEVEEKLFTPLEEKSAKAYEEARNHFTELWAEGDRLPTEQDRVLCAMLRPERLMELMYGYIVFDEIGRAHV